MADPADSRRACARHRRDHADRIEPGHQSHRLFHQHHRRQHDCGNKTSDDAPSDHDRFHRQPSVRFENCLLGRGGGLPMKPIVIGRGIVAGFVATVVLSAMMLMKQSMGLMPGLDPIGMITSMAGASSLAIGWIGHLVIGTIFWGIGFAIVSPYLPGPHWLRGAIFATGAWLMMMIVMMPIAGAGLFGQRLGMMTPVVT